MSIVKRITRDLRPYMESYGYISIKNGFYRSQNSIAYFIEFEKPSSIVYLRYYVVPLYIPCNSKYYSYGSRLRQHGALMSICADASSAAVDNWSEDTRSCLESIVFPFFNSIGSPEQLIAFLENCDTTIKEHFACTDVQLLKLRVYTLFYCGEIEQGICIFHRDRILFDNCTYLTERVQKKNIAEMESLVLLAKTNVEELALLFKNTIAGMQRIVFK